MRAITPLFVLFILLNCVLPNKALAWGKPLTAEELTDLENRAEAGEVEALKDLSYRYNKGQGVQRSTAKAVKYFKVLAEQGDTGSMLWVGRFYKNGEAGLTKDYHKALYWLKKGAEKKDMWAIVEIPELFQFGHGDFAQDHVKMEEWLNKAEEIAKHCGGVGQYILGCEFDSGRKIPQDYSKALKWYLAGAKQGHTGCNVQAAEIYYKGKGMEVNQDKARELLAKAIRRDGQKRTIDFFVRQFPREEQEEVRNWYTPPQNHSPEEIAELNRHNSKIVGLYIKEHADSKTTIPLGSFGWSRVREYWSKVPELQKLRDDFEEANRLLQEGFNNSKEYMEARNRVDELSRSDSNSTDLQVARQLYRETYQRLRKTEPIKSLYANRQSTLRKSNEESLKYIVADYQKQNKLIHIDWIPEEKLKGYQTQVITNNALKKMVKKFECLKGMALVANPKTGKILASAVVDSKQNIAEKPLNDIGLFMFEPGSVITPIFFASALDLAVIDKSGKYSPKELSSQSPSIEDLLLKSFATRNYRIAEIAQLMGKEKLYNAFQKFGFGEKTSIRIGNESKGIFRSIDRWDGLSIKRLPIGQGISVTPLQVLQAYCTLANNGVMMQLKKECVTSCCGHNKPERKRWVLKNPQTAKEITKALCKNTNNNVAIEGIQIAGKTSTSQKWDHELKRYSREKYVSSYIGYFPAEKPKYVILIIADEPAKEKGYYGGTVAAPTFKEIAEKLIEASN